MSASRPTPSAGEREQPLVLIVDDEEHITELIAMALGFNGFRSERCASGRAALAAVGERRPDLILLDVMLPDLDGFEVARRLRDGREHDSRTPIIFLTARDATADKVAGLRIGVDDYVTKPFSIEELVERVRAVLRRSGPARADHHDDVVRVHDLSLDAGSREVSRGGRPIELTPTEFRLLRYLMVNARQVLSREQILAAVWDDEFAGNASVLETYISYLRHKVDVEAPALIHTVRGIGYRLRAPSTTSPAADG